MPKKGQASCHLSFSFTLKLRSKEVSIVTQLHPATEQYGDWKVKAIGCNKKVDISSEVWYNGVNGGDTSERR